MVAVLDLVGFLWFAVGFLAYGYGVAFLAPRALNPGCAYLREARTTCAVCALFGPIFLAVLIVHGKTNRGWRL